MLKKFDKSWMFVEERILEDFLWLHLESSLDLIPLKRQFTIKGEYCDILAKTKDNQLVVLELKNCEDRYIIHQLTRYYHGLFVEQPFKDSIDYNLPIRLIAIAPDFHRHNFIDRHYNKLEFEFIRFSIVEQADKFYLNLHLPEREEITIREPIPFNETNLPESQHDRKIQIAPPPRLLLNFLDKFSLWLPLPKNLLASNRVSGIGRISMYCGSDFLDVKSVTSCTQDGRFATGSSMSVDEYLDKIGLKLSEPIVDKLFELAVKLNLERN